MIYIYFHVGGNKLWNEGALLIADILKMNKVLKRLDISMIEYIYN